MKLQKMFPVIGGVLVAGLLAAALLPLLWLPGDHSAGQTENQRLIGATYMTMNNPFYQELDARLQSAVEARGDRLLTRDAVMDQDRQNEEIADLLDRGVSAILLNPVDWEKVGDGLRLAADAGVPVIVIDAPVKDDSLVTSTILSDNYQAGVQCAEHLLSVRDSANILLLEHITARSGADRIRGFVETIQGHEGFAVVGSGSSDGQIENAMPVMEQLLAEHPEADVVMALNDPSALGALAAIEGAGLSDRFLVYGVDGSPEGKVLVADGLMTATSTQMLGEMAETAVEQAYLALDGGTPEKEIVLPVTLLTKDNVAQYGTSGWQ